MELDLVKEKMDNALSFFEKELSSVRTSRASATMLDIIQVDSYGTKIPINQLGNISIPDSNLITIKVWDVNFIKPIESAILESNLGINPQTDGPLIRLPIPKLSEERREELAKVVSKYSESSKITIRNIRREIMDSTKKDEKDKNISQDKTKKILSDIQSITDEYISKIDSISLNKQTEILKV